MPAGNARPARSRHVPRLAYILPAKLMAMTVIDLLAGGATAAREILDAYTPAMTKDEYLAFMRRNSREEQFDGASPGIP